MSKQKYNKQYMYNRQSKGYQQNLYKQHLKENNIKAPKALSEKKLKISAIVAAIVWIVATVLLYVYLGWKGLLVGIVIGALVFVGVVLFLRNKQREMIRYYKQVGMTEEMYIREMRKRNNDPKQLEAARKLWRKVEVE